METKSSVVPPSFVDQPIIRRHIIMTDEQRRKLGRALTEDELYEAMAQAWEQEKRREAQK